MKTSTRKSKSPQEKKLQSGNGQGGFMALLHSLEEKFYGPEVRSLSASAMSVLLYIRHRALRDWVKRKQIGKAEIRDATGLSERMVDYALRDLAKKKFISVTKIVKDNVFQGNVYELHPDRYGNDYVYRPEKPSFRVIYGDKMHESNRAEPVQEIAPGAVQQTTSGGVQPLAPDDTSNYSESLNNSPSKNPLKEPIKKTLSEDMDFQREKGTETESEATAREAAMELIRKSFRGMPRGMH